MTAPLDPTDPAAVAREAEHRRRCRALGIPFTADPDKVERERAEVLALATGRPVPATPENPAALEKETQAAIVKLFRAHGCTVFNLSQPRHAKYLTPGIPDLWIFHRRTQQAWWWESKRPTGGKLSPAQQEFRAFCAETRVLHGVGSVADAEAWLCERGITDHPGPPADHPAARAAEAA